MNPERHIPPPPPPLTKQSVDDEVEQAVLRIIGRPNKPTSSPTPFVTSIGQLGSLFGAEDRRIEQVARYLGIAANAPLIVSQDG